MAPRAGDRFISLRAPAGWRRLVLNLIRIHTCIFFSWAKMEEVITSHAGEMDGKSEMDGKCEVDGKCEMKGVGCNV